VSYANAPNPNQWWSNTLGKSEGKLTLEALKQEMQKTQICSLCGLSLGSEPNCIDSLTQSAIHKVCPS